MLSTHFADEKLRLREGESLAPHLRPSESLTLRRAVSGLLNAACSGCPWWERGREPSSDCDEPLPGPPFPLPLLEVEAEPHPLAHVGRRPHAHDPRRAGTSEEARSVHSGPFGTALGLTLLIQADRGAGSEMAPAPPVTGVGGGTRLGAPPASSLHRQGPPPSSWPFPAPRKPARPSWSGHLFPAPSGRPSRPGLGSRNPASPVPTPLRARGPGPGMAGLVRPRPGCLLGSRSPSGGASALLASGSCPCPPGPLSFPRSRVWGGPGARDY